MITWDKNREMALTKAKWHSQKLPVPNERYPLIITTIVVVLYTFITYEARSEMIMKFHVILCFLYKYLMLCLLRDFSHWKLFDRNNNGVNSAVKYFSFFFRLVRNNRTRNQKFNFNIGTYLLHHWPFSDNLKQDKNIKWMK